MKKDTARLVDFLDLIPDRVRAAFEFRHPSWHDDEVYDSLRSAGAALVLTDTTEDSTPRVATANWGYLRLRREAYSDHELNDWAAWTHQRAWSDVFTFFKHEDGATGPALAARFEAAFGAHRPS